MAGLSLQQAGRALPPGLQHQKRRRWLPGKNRGKMLDSGYLEGPSLGVRPLLPGSRPQTVRAGTQVGLQICARKAVTTKHGHR